MDSPKIKTIGTKNEVYRGIAKHTAGGLKKENLKKNNSGKVVSKNASAAAKKNNNLVKAGYVTEKGKFGAVYKSPKKTRDSPKKKRKSPKKKTEYTFF